MGGVFWEVEVVDFRVQRSGVREEDVWLGYVCKILSPPGREEARS